MRFLSVRIEVSDDFFPVVCSIQKCMLEYDIAIPWLLHQDTGDPIHTEFVSILHRVIDHDAHSDLMAYLGFWFHIIGEVVHEVDIRILDI